MQPQPTLAAMLTCALLLAGCSAPETTKDVEAPLTGDFDDQVGAPVISGQASNGTLGVGTPLLLRGTAGPDTPLTSFEWRIPEGAIMNWRPSTTFDFVIEVITIQYVPLLPEGVTIEDYVIAVFTEEGNLATMSLGTPIHTQSRTGPIIDAGETFAPELDPGILAIFAGGLEEGDTVFFVIGAKATVPTPISLLLSVSDEDLGDTDVPDDSDELLANRTAVALPVLATGAGMQMAFYLNFNIYIQTFLINIEQWTDAIQITDRIERMVEPAVTVRDATVQAEFGIPGHAQSFVEYWGSATLSTGTFDIQADLHGTVLDHRNLVFDSGPVFLPSTIITGIPVLFGVGDGGGSASTQIDIQVASANQFEIFIVEQIDFGATLRDLTGVDATVGGSVYRGVAGNIPPSYMWIHGDDIVMLRGNAFHQVHGHAGPLAAALESGAPQLDWRLG